MKKVSMSQIQQRVAGMLKEDTGMHMMDSGGESGRAWQQNQGRDFANEPQVTAEVSGDEVTFSRSTFDFLSSNLAVSPSSEKLNSQFRAFLKTPEIKKGDSPDWGSGTMQSFMEKLFPEQGDMLVDIYSDEDGQVGKVDNTYNYENTLDQSFQYAMFRKDGKTYVLLSIHGGADVRGGYTVPQVFEVRDPENWMMGMVDLYASDGANAWHSDDAGYHWYGDMGGAKDLDGDIKKQWTLDAAKQKVISKLNGKSVRFFAGGEE